MPRFRPANFLIALATILAALLASHADAQDVEVGVELDQFGVGGMYRPGDVAAVRLKLTSGMAEPATVWVQWEIPNVDGDMGEYGRSVALTPGQPRLVWLYAPLPPETGVGTTWPVRVFALEGVTRKRELGGTRISATPAADGNEAIIGVIGSTAHLGLRGYSNPGINIRRPPYENEFTHIVTSIRTEDLPDRWEGWKCFEAVAWAEADPASITPDQATALREYVRRGGELVIILPQVGSPWALGSESRTSFHDVLPTKEPRKDEATMLSDVLPIMSKSRTTKIDFEFPVHVFKELGGSFDAIDNSYEPLMALKDGRVVVIRRTYGFGWITISGVDVAYRRLYSVPLGNGSSGLPQADVFWNRILGRRSDTPSPTELADIENTGRLSANVNEESSLGSGRLFLQQISMSQEATIGLLASLLLFAVYWIAAGPGGFYALKMYKSVKYSWLAFAAAAGIFTAVAWGTVGLIRQNEVAVKHVTFLDHIYRPGEEMRKEDPQFQRASSWLSLRLPGYGKTSVTLTPTETADGLTRDLLYSWTPPGSPMQPFPNTDRYRVDVGQSPGPAAYDHYPNAGNTSDYRLPARATSTLLHADWLGGVDPKWGGLLSVAEPIHVVTEPGTGREIGLSGAIRSDLPGALTDITIIWVRSSRMNSRTYQPSGDKEMSWVPTTRSGDMLNLGYIVRSTTALPTGNQFDLGVIFNPKNPQGGADLKSNIHKRYIDPYLNDSVFNNQDTGTLRENDIRNFMEMLSIFNQLDPPNYLRDTPHGKTDPTLVAYRLLGRQLDLSVWFTRPCLIILGYLKNSDLPIPLLVNGETPVTEDGSVTMIRWIYPLPLDEELAFRYDIDDSAAEKPPDGSESSK